jgi:hypothetical protein
MNVKYVRIPTVPSYERYGDLLDAVASGDYFITCRNVGLTT